MNFKTFTNEMLLTIHTPNQSPKERLAFFEVKEESGSLVLGERNRKGSFLKRLCLLGRVFFVARKL
jgi:hypothetical protein